jgi:hypothetical protein
MSEKLETQLAERKQQKKKEKPSQKPKQGGPSKSHPVDTKGITVCFLLLLGCSDLTLILMISKGQEAR